MVKRRTYRNKKKQRDKQRDKQRGKQRGGEDDDNINDGQQELIGDVNNANISKNNNTDFKTDIKDDFCNNCDVINKINEIYRENKLYQVNQKKELEVDSFYDESSLSQLDITKNPSGKEIKLTSKFDFYHYMAYNLEIHRRTMRDGKKFVTNELEDLEDLRNQCKKDISRFSTLTLNDIDLNSQLKLAENKNPISVFNNYLRTNLKQYGITDNMICIIDIMTPQSALKPFFDIGKNYIVKNLKSFNGQSRLLPQKIEENYTIIFNEETKQIIRRIVFDLLFSDTDQMNFIHIGIYIITIICDLNTLDYSINVKITFNHNLKDINKIIELDDSNFESFVNYYTIGAKEPNLKLTATEVDNFLGKEQAKDERKEIESKWEEQKKQKEETQEKVNKVQNVALPGVGIVAAASGLALAFLLGGKTRRRKYKNRTRRKRIKMTKIRK
jgi:hypothetical protein